MGEKEHLLGFVPLFRHAWRVPFCTTTSPRFDMNGLGVIKFHPNLAVIDVIGAVFFIAFFSFQTIGTVPRSMMYSVPVMEACGFPSLLSLPLSTSRGAASAPVNLPPVET